jgi:hypothetical protein
MQDVQDRRLAEEAHGLAPAAACRRTLRPEMAPIQVQIGAPCQRLPYAFGNGASVRMGSGLWKDC